MNIVSENLEYVLFLSGLWFELLAIVALALGRRQAASRPWFWLAAGGFVLGGHAWVEVLALGLPDAPALLVARVATLVAGAGLLAEFGRRGVRWPNGRSLMGWIYLPLLALAAFAVLSGRAAGVRGLSIYAMGLVSGGLACLALWQTARAVPAEERFGLRSAAAGLAAYSLAAGPVTLPLTFLMDIWPDHEHLLAAAEMPALVAQMICVGLVTYGLWHTYQTGWRHTLGDAAAERARIGGWHLLAALGFVLIAGWGLTAETGHVTDVQMRSELLIQARMVGQGIDPARVQTLTGTAADLASPDYARLKEQLVAVRAANPQIRFLYLMGTRADQVFFYVDSEPPESKDYSPPGQVYEEAAAEPDWWRGMFQGTTEEVSGPDTDRWGVWVSATVPIHHPQTGAVLALLGMDMDAHDWARAIRRASLFPILVTLFVAAALSVTRIINRRSLEAGWRIATSEERYRLFLQNFVGIAYQIDPLTLRPILFHGTVTEITGYTADDFLNNRMMWPQIIHPDDLAAVRAWGEELRAMPGRTADHEYRILHRDGRVRWVRDIAGHWQSAAGRLIQGGVYDITERKRAEEALRESEVKLKTLFDILPVGVSILDDELNIVDLNPALGRILDISREGLLGGEYRRRCYLCHDGSLMPPDEFPSFRAWKEQVVVSDVETGIVKEDGAIVWASVSAAPLPIQGLSAAIVTTDITERKRAEDALRESADTLRAVFNATDEAIFLLAVDEIVLALNDVAAQRMGCSRETVIGRKVTDLLPADVVARRRPFVARALLTGEPVSFEDEWNGRWMANHLYPILNADGQVVRLAIFSRDITERKQAEQRAFELALERERMALLTKFILDVSHEFRTPLTIMQTNVYLLERSEDPVKRQRRLAQISEQVRGIVRLVEELAEMARIDSGVPFTLQPTDLNRLLAAEAAKVQAAAAATGLTLRLALAPDLPPVPADDNRLGRALYELLDNAVRFTPAGGRVTVCSARDAGGVMVEVQDTGPGIAPDVLPRIFERFYRQDVTHTTPGFGLGLPIARAIVERHGGRLEVESQPGAGSAFRVWLPA